MALLQRVIHYVDRRDLENALLSLKSMEAITPNSDNIEVIKNYINKIFMNDKKKEEGKK